MAGYSGTPLVRKLGLKAGHVIHVINVPAEYFDWLHPLPDDLKVKPKLAGEFDFIHLFTKERKRFEDVFPKAARYMKKDGMLWVSWPKKASKVATDLDENIIRKFGLKQGLVDVKVCAVDEVWWG